MLKNDTQKTARPAQVYMEVPPGQFSVFPQKVNISKIVKNRPMDRVNFPFIKSHIIHLCVEVREHHYILKIKPTSILYQTLFLIVCQPFFIVCPR